MKNKSFFLFTFPFFILSLLTPLTIMGQNYTMGIEEYMTWEDFISEYVDELEQNINAPNKNQLRNDFIEILEELHNHPSNINTASKDDLLRIPFLNEAQVDSILAYRNKKHLLRSLGELQWINGLSYETRSRLSLFTFTGDTLNKPTPLGQRLYKGKHEIISRFDIPLYQRAGYKDRTKLDLSSHPNAFYLGNSLANTIRYRYQWRHDVGYGLTLQKDSGEPFAKEGNYPYDYISLYMYFRTLSQKVSLWLGDYNIHAGQGLLLSNQFFYGAQQMTENNKTIHSKIKPHTSSDEYNFFRGGAISALLGKHGKVTFFASLRTFDGRIDHDTITSIKTDGLHRTTTEIDRRNIANNFSTGGRIEWDNLKWSIGTNFYYSKYSRPIYPQLKEYNRYYLRGKNAAGGSFDYIWKNRYFEFSGETAADQNFHPGTSNTFHYSPNTNTCFTLHQHSFSPQLVAPFGNTFQDNSRVQNEHGLMAGVSLHPFNRTNLTSYFFYYYHPRPTYNACLPAHGFETFLQIKYEAKKNFHYTFKYKMKAEQSNIRGTKNMLEYVTSHRSRFSFNFTRHRFYLNASIDAAAVTHQTRNNTFGWMLSSRNRFNITKQLTFQTFTAAFFTDDYESRLYAYEPQLQYAASFPTFAYHGIRCIGLLQWKIKSKGYAAIKYGFLHYFNKDKIGSGAQEINDSSKHDISLQLAWNF